MAFWRFGFSQSAIDTILASVQSQPTSDVPRAQANLPIGGTDSPQLHPEGREETVSGALEGPTTLLNAESSRHPSQNDSHLIITLDQLLEEDDVLQETKTGNAKLVEFLGKPSVVRRMLQYIDGSAFSEDTQADLDNLPQEQQDKIAKRRLKFPHVCSEIMMSNVHSIAQELLSGLSFYMVPFWDALLNKTPLETLGSSAAVAHWGRLNCHLLSEHTTEMLDCIKSRPQMIDSLVQHLSTPAVSDFLFKIIQAEETPNGHGIVDYLSQHGLMSKLLDLLSPMYPMITHTSVTEFLKAIITFCSTANANAGTAEFAPPGNNFQHQPQSKWGQAAREQQQQQEEKAKNTSIWVSHALLRDLSSASAIQTLLSHMLDENIQPKVVDPRDESKTKNDSQADPSTLFLPTVMPAPMLRDPANAAGTASSIRHSLSIIIDLIRKNNSDFTEQQILHYLRKKEAEQVTSDSDTAIKSGPSVVDLSHLLVLVSQRLQDLQNVLTSDKLKSLQISTTIGTISPLSIERFRICELYAEMLHCSNMAMLNRPKSSSLSYNAHGSLTGGIDSLSILETALIQSAPDAVDADDDAVTEAEPEPEAVEVSTGAATEDKSDDSIATSTYGSPKRTHSEGSGSVRLDNGGEEVSFESDSSMSVTAASSPVISQHGKRQSLTGALNGDATRRELQQRRQTDTVPGQQLKIAFLDNHVIKTLFDLFFDHPWHNFLHNVVYDLVQQLFNGRLDLPLNRRLCLDALNDASLIRRILDAHASNEELSQSPHKRRLGYMGHLSLIAEEAVKLFAHHPDIADEAAASIPQSEWEAFVSGPLRETREKDLQHLGGGISANPNDTITSANSGLSDDDDDFPSASGSNGTWRSIKGDEIESAALGSAASTLNSTGESSFASFLAKQRSAMSSNRSSSSSSEDEEGDGPMWPKLREHQNYETRDASDSRLDIDSSDSDSDDDFGTFSTAPSNSNRSAASSSTMNGKQPSKTNLTAADWNSDFKSSFTFSPEPEKMDDNPFASAEDDESGFESDDGDDDFGDFASASSPPFTASGTSSTSGTGPSKGLNDSTANGFDDDFGMAPIDLVPLSSPPPTTIDPSKETIRPDGLISVQVEGEDAEVIVPPDELAIATSPKLGALS